MFLGRPRQRIGRSFAVHLLVLLRESAVCPLAMFHKNVGDGLLIAGRVSQRPMNEVESSRTQVLLRPDTKVLVKYLTECSFGNLAFGSQARDGVTEFSGRFQVFDGVPHDFIAGYSRTSSAVPFCIGIRIGGR